MALLLCCGDEISRFRRAGTGVFIGSRREISVDEDEIVDVYVFREDESVEFGTWTLC